MALFPAQWPCWFPLWSRPWTNASWTRVTARSPGLWSPHSGSFVVHGPHRVGLLIPIRIRILIRVQVLVEKALKMLIIEFTREWSQSWSLYLRLLASSALCSPDHLCSRIWFEILRFGRGRVGMYGWHGGLMGLASLAARPWLQWRQCIAMAWPGWSAGGPDWIAGFLARAKGKCQSQSQAQNRDQKPSNYDRKLIRQRERHTKSGLKGAFAAQKGVNGISVT